jgi:hypothetical protein
VNLDMVLAIFSPMKEQVQQVIGVIEEVSGKKKR